jgi:predicted Zn-dependent protease
MSQLPFKLPPERLVRVRARLALAESYLRQSRWSELEQLLASLQGEPSVSVACVVLRTHLHLARQEFAAARTLLAGAIARWPREVQPRLMLGYTHMQEGIDPAAAEQALLEALALDPTNDEAILLLVRLHRRIALQWH